MTHPLPDEATMSAWAEDIPADENPLPISLVSADPEESSALKALWQPALAGLLDLAVDFILAVPATLEVAIAHVKRQFSCDQVTELDLACDEPAEEGRLSLFTEPFEE